MKELLSFAEIRSIKANDPMDRFLKIAELCYDRLSAAEDIEMDRGEFDLLRQQYIATVVGAAKASNIPELSGTSIPSINQIDNGQFTNFRAHVTKIATEIAIGMAESEAADGEIAFSESTASRVRSLMSHLLDEIDKLQIKDSIKSKIRRKISEAQIELDRPDGRFDATKVILVTAAITAFLADAPGAYTTIRSLNGKITEAVGKQYVIEKLLAKDEIDPDEIRLLDHSSSKVEAGEQAPDQTAIAADLK